MHTLENHGLYHTRNRTVFRCRHDHILRAHDDIDFCSHRKVFKTGKLRTTEIHFADTAHMTGVNVALTDKVRNKYGMRLIINLLRRTDLLNLTVGHNHNLIRHGQGFFLVMGNVDEGDTQLFVHGHQLQLHLFSHL